MVKKIIITLVLIISVMLSSIPTYAKAKTKKVKIYLGKVKASAYYPINGSRTTASGKRARAKHTIAVDMHNPIAPMGSKIKIGKITYTVEDVGNLHKYGREFDIFFNTRSEACNYGVRIVKAYRVKTVKKKKTKKLKSLINIRFNIWNRDSSSSVPFFFFVEFVI